MSEEMYLPDLVRSEEPQFMVARSHFGSIHVRGNVFARSDRGREQLQLKATKSHFSSFPDVRNLFA